MFQACPSRRTSQGAPQTAGGSSRDCRIAVWVMSAMEPRALESHSSPLRQLRKFEAPRIRDIGRCAARVSFLE